MKRLYLLVVFAFFQIIVSQGQVSWDFRAKGGWEGLWNRYCIREACNKSLWAVTSGDPFNLSSTGTPQGETSRITLFRVEHYNLPEPIVLVSHLYPFDFSVPTQLDKHSKVYLNTILAKSIDSLEGVCKVSTSPAKKISNKKADFFSGTVTVGTGGNYSTLTGANGLFEKLNSGQVNGNLIVNIISNLTEDGANILNAWAEGPGGPYTVTLHPVGHIKISLEGISENIKLCIKLNGTKRFKIDGINDGVNDLTIVRMSGASTSGVIEFINGASENKVTRTTIYGNNSSNCHYVITFSNSSTAVMKNDTVSYCMISSADNSSPTSQGVLLTGTKSTGNGIIIDHNVFTNFINGAIQQTNGYYTNTKISNNEIYNTFAASSGDNYNGIFLTNYIGKTNIYNNRIHDILCKSGSNTNSISAINCSTNTSDSLNIYNNLIYLDATVTHTGLGINGIILYNNGIATLRYNTIYIGGVNVLSKGSTCFYSEGLGSVSITNNIFINARSNTTGKGIHYGIFNNKTYNTIISKNNDIYTSGTGGCFGHFLKDYATLKDWQAAKIQDENSVSIDPQFTSMIDFTPQNTALKMGIPISGITTDLNGTLRDVATPTLGVYELRCLNPTNGGTIASDQTVWGNDAPALITSVNPASGYSGRLEYKWQSKLSKETTWTDIPASNTVIYQPGKIAETTLFKRLARSACMTNWLGSAESNPVTITFQINKWKGSTDTNWNISENWTRKEVPGFDSNIVFDDQPIHDCLMDQDRSVNDITINQSDIKLITNGRTLTVKGNLNLTNGAKIDASSQNSAIVLSGTAFQTIPSGAFVANKISNLTINNVSGASFESDLTIEQLLTINPSTQLIIPTEKLLDVKGKIINHGGISGLVIKASPTGSVANGSLIFHNVAGQDPTVPATVEMYSRAAREAETYKWQFFGIPLESIPANPAFAGSYVREMHENVIGTTGHWEQLQNESILTAFTGYEITQEAPKTIRFEGELVNKDYGPVELSYTNDATYKGQHLIANPYTSAINIRNTVEPSNSLIFGDGMDKTVYLYNTGSKKDWSSNSSNGSSDFYAPGQYLAVPQDYAGSDLPVSIPSMQAFLVMVKTPGSTATVSIPYSSTGTLVKNTTILRAPAAERVFTRIDVSGSNSSDRMWLFTDSTCTRNFDNSRDGYKMMGSILMPQIFASEVDGDYQVNSISDINNTYLGFKAGIDSAYTLTFTHHNTTNHYREIYLIDLIDTKSTDITDDKSTYTFFLKSGSPVEKRFRIIAIPAHDDLSTSDESTDEKLHSLTVFSSKNNIVVNNKSSQNGNLYLYDITGRFIHKIQFHARSVDTFPVSLPTGAYITKAITPKNEIVTTLMLGD